ncbi:hypothetical protein P3T25_006644 [Paraburkholderia sp. GAS32]|jgi:hypothetical protein
MHSPASYAIGDHMRPELQGVTCLACVGCPTSRQDALAPTMRRRI